MTNDMATGILAAMELKQKYKDLQAENKRLREFIEKHHPKHQHDHEYFHDHCFLCAEDEKRYKLIEQVLTNETNDSATDD
ncbi:hypothetical protein LCGC14_0346430 [marine sediment metagenome]|uniref:Uncharacterized protein n=1 Tax=marine sediment metagenome TaxID=412755 RepID=A0A0F9VZP5_9ZZZZ